ncbi:MAG TPA: hypothetical protein VGJ77_06795 [Gaiellaceae bacterium]|jgi:hypothetical protein
MKVRSLIVAAVAAATLALAGTASADVYSVRPGDVYGHKPGSNTWSGLHVAGTKWMGIRAHSGNKWGGGL